ncbi:hypothetical protein KVR01_003072 [Diaporthe batatas]|uniref:uncharacterized protein n=1 Tax=Diaporthe batatas TaxID=748121 RepID=UPI001D03B6FA|nr:uncharacterized protein KVR01_003072 [Diaporthe batatas]KAG8167383.1 hypothetical protein KVR01_003072 [Diaporthe batatas]
MAPIPKRQTQTTGITVPPKWKGKIPAFLFRGWKSESGGNSRLNTKDAVTPHAFYGSRGEPGDKLISKIPQAQIQSEIMGHLGGGLVTTHFSSWAADLQTALGFAGVGKDAHIAVFETSLRGQHNEIYHVPALKEMGLTPCYFPEEYLVYGPVSGEAYTCVSVRRLRDLNLGLTVASRIEGKSKVSVAELKHCEKIAYEFRPKRHIASKGPALFLAVFAAELGRLLRAAHGSNVGVGWSQDDNKKILSHLSALGLVDRAAKKPQKNSLVNPKTFVDGFPQLKAMVDILMTLGLEIERRRPEASKLSSSKTLEPPKSGKKRKFDDTKAPKDPKQPNSQSMHPLDAQAHLLRGRLISVLTEKLESVKSVPEVTGKSMHRSASHLDILIKWALDFDAELDRAAISISSLSASCNGLIGSLNGEKARSARPRKHLHKRT